MAQTYTRKSSEIVTNPIPKNASFGARQARTAGTTYQETSHGFCVYYTSSYSAALLIGPSSPPTIDVIDIHFTGGSGGCGMMCYLPKNWYWNFSSGPGFFIPLNYA